MKSKKRRIIQGGMGVGVSNYKLAREVSLNGGLGIVSGTGLKTVFIRRLQLGDKDMLKALEAFPNQEISEKAFKRHFSEEGKLENHNFKLSPMFGLDSPKSLIERNILANFAEVYLAKLGHNEPVGINYLEKIQLPHLSSIYGAMLAGVDVITMGAGIPRQVPNILDRLSEGKDVSYKLFVEGATKDWETFFDPKTFLETEELKRPDFLGIVSSNTLAQTLKQKSYGTIDGLIIEGHTAGGHNATPRRKGTTFYGEPEYTDKDEVNLEKIRRLELPYWLAGSYGSPDKLKFAIEQGAEGIQVGTLFALADESGITKDFKEKILRYIKENKADIYTDPKASPTGFPFKVFRIKGSSSDEEVVQCRDRICDLGYLRTLYETEEGKLGYRCPSEPVEDFLRKGGKLEDTVGRLCVCNALSSNIGIGQINPNGEVEPFLITSGKDIKGVEKLISDKQSYSVKDVMNYLNS